MKLENYEVHLPSYSIGDHIYDKIGPVCESYGNTVLLIGGRRALKAAEEKIRTYVAKTNLEIIGFVIDGKLPQFFHGFVGTVTAVQFDTDDFYVCFCYISADLFFRCF